MQAYDFQIDEIVGKQRKEIKIRFRFKKGVGFLSDFVRFLKRYNVIWIKISEPPFPLI